MYVKGGGDGGDSPMYVPRAHGASDEMAVEDLEGVPEVTFEITLNGKTGAGGSAPGTNGNASTKRGAGEMNGADGPNAGGNGRKKGKKSPKAPKGKKAPDAPIPGKKVADAPEPEVVPFAEIIRRKRAAEAKEAAAKAKGTG